MTYDSACGWEVMLQRGCGAALSSMRRTLTYSRTRAYSCPFPRQGCELSWVVHCKV